MDLKDKYIKILRDHRFSITKSEDESFYSIKIKPIVPVTDFCRKASIGTIVLNESFCNDIEKIFCKENSPKNLSDVWSFSCIQDLVKEGKSDGTLQVLKDISYNAELFCKFFETIRDEMKKAGIEE